MMGTIVGAQRLAFVLMWTSIALAATMAVAVAAERAAVALQEVRRRRAERRYTPLLKRAFDERDEVAVRDLARSPLRHRLAIARMMIEPLIEDRDPERIVRTRAIVDSMQLIPIADRYLRSWWWWRRAIALRALGLVQVRDRTAAMVAALDDRSPDVRAAALDALADLRDPASLLAVVVRLHDASLARGRRAAALAAFGSGCEPFLLELAHFDARHRVNYARALAICGTARSRPALTRWAEESPADVRAAALEALAHVGLDDNAARIAIAALESTDAAVRTMAAAALRGWDGAGDAASQLARHLDDAWPVAIRAARSLQSTAAGLLELQARTSRSDMAGLLARQMLWQGAAQW